MMINWNLVAIILASMILGVLIVYLIGLKTLKPKEFGKFYQIWLTDEKFSDNFIVMSGHETDKWLVTHNSIKFKKDKYFYTILPFANNTLTNKDLFMMDEGKYLEICLTMTKNMSEEKDKEVE